MKSLWSLGCCRSIMTYIVRMFTWCRQRYLTEGGNGESALLTMSEQDTEGAEDTVPRAV